MNEKYLIISPSGESCEIEGTPRSFNDNYILIYDGGTNTVVASVPSTHLLLKKNSITE